MVLYILIFVVIFAVSLVIGLLVFNQSIKKKQKESRMCYSKNDETHYYPKRFDKHSNQDALMKHHNSQEELRNLHVQQVDMNVMTHIMENTFKNS